MKIVSYTRKILRIIKNDGIFGLLNKIVNKLRRQSPLAQKTKISMLVDYSDAIKADWTTPREIKSTRKRVKKHYTIDWVMSPPGIGSGGHQNIFRFIRFLEQAGHNCRIYLYSTQDKRLVSEVREILKHSYPSVKAPISWIKKPLSGADAVFATGWETAYPVFNSENNAKRFYFVQDFEPSFYPMGSEYILAENTYKFGFFGITAGGWLAKKLNTEYGMQTDHFDFGADPKNYSLTNTGKRREIFFYARPVTARRGFEIGIMALDIFHKKHPEYTINLAGWDTSNYDIPFPHNNLSSLRIEDLSDIYNKCAAGLLLSLTNMSLLPLELLTCGVIPVVNDGENNRLVSNNPYIHYTAPSPADLARKLSSIVENPDAQDYALKASASTSRSNWEEPGRQFVEIVERELRK